MCRGIGGVGVHTELLHIINTTILLKHCLKTGECYAPLGLRHYGPSVFEHLAPLPPSPSVKIWLERMRGDLRARDANLLLEAMERPELLGFANTLPAGIVTWYDDRTTLWPKSWTWNEQNAGWDISYVECATPGLPAEPPRYDDPRPEYRRVLEEIIPLGRKMPYGGPRFADNYFCEALAYLDGKQPDRESFFLESKMPEENRRLLHAASAAYVFGGMGSWNDLIPPAHLSDKYNHLTSALHRSINQIFMHAVNTW